MFVFAKPLGTLRLTGSLFSSDTGQITVKLSDAFCPVNPLAGVADGSLQFRVSSPTVDLRATVVEDQAIILQVTNPSTKTIRVEDVKIDFSPSTFSPPLPSREYRHLVHARDLEMVSHIKPVHLPSEFASANPESGMVTVYSHDATGRALLIGTLPPFGSAYSYIRAWHDSLHMEGLFGINIRFEFRQDLEPGASLSTSPLVALEGIGGERLLETYGEMIHRRLSRPPKPLATGWNSWDYYAGAITRQDIDENITALNRHFGRKVRYIVIDEGWECMWGVWQSNWKFSEGLGDLCRQIKASGYTPGIWTAPLMVNYYTPLYRNHPDWFVGDANGNVYLSHLSYGIMAQLDITVPEVQDHLREIYTGLRKCGFEYFKVDFSQMILGADKFHDSRVGRAEIIRKVFQLIRECIGEECYLLSCGGPWESVIGIVDACRISSDIHNHWSMIVQNIQCLLVRGWMQGNIGKIDPDFLIVRSDETTDDRQLKRRQPIAPRSRGSHWLDGAEMTTGEAKVLALSLHLAGGDMIMSDAMGKLNAKALEMLNKVITPLPSPAKVLNLFDPQGSLYPMWLAKAGNECLLGVFNLTDNAVTREIDLACLNVSWSKQAFDFWTDEAIEISGRFQLTLAPRSAKGLKIRCGGVR